MTDPAYYAVWVNGWRNKKELKDMDAAAIKDVLASKLSLLGKGRSEDLKKQSVAQLVAMAPRGAELRLVPPMPPVPGPPIPEPDKSVIVWEDSPTCIKEGKVRIILAGTLSPEKSMNNSPEDDRLAEQLHTYHATTNPLLAPRYMDAARQGKCDIKPSGKVELTWQVANTDVGGFCGDSSGKADIPMYNTR